jgi:hypothetical protein
LPGGAGILSLNGSGVANISGPLEVFNTPGSGITLSAGTINTHSLDLNGNPSVFNWTGGTLNVTNTTTFDSLGPTNSTSAAFGQALSLNNGMELQITGDETLGGTGSFSLTLNSGAIHDVTGNVTLAPTGVLTQNGGSTLIYNSFTMAGGSVNGTLTNPTTFTYQSGSFNGRLLNAGKVNYAANLTLQNGLENDGNFSVGDTQILTLNGAGLDNIGIFVLTGGTINGAGPVLNDFSGNMAAVGSISSPFTNDGLLTVNSGALRFGSTAVNNGVLSGDGTIFGNFSNAAPGTIQIPNTFTLAFNSPWTNSGPVSVQGGQLGGATVTNNSTIQGQGFVNASVANSGVIRAVGGQLDITASGSTNGISGQIQAATGNSVFFSSGLATNNGTIALTGGSFDNNNQAITNSSTGHISGWGTFSSGGLTNAGNFNIGGNFNIFGPVTNNVAASIHATDPGLNAFFGPVINNGSITINSGSSITFFNSFTGAGTITNNGAIAFNAIASTPGIGGGGLLTIGATSASTSLTLTPNSGTSTQGALVLNSGSTLDITNNTLKIIFGAPAIDPVATITGYLKSGFNTGAWTGTGLTSSTAAAGSPGRTLAVGIADGNTDAGLTIAAPNQIVVKYTLQGDTNLDGLVNFNDLVTVVQNFNKANTDWAHGNFLFSASTNFNDLVAVVQNFNKILTPAGSSGDQIGVGGAIPLSAIVQTTDVQLPEPAIAPLMVLGATLLARRRRHA